MKLELHLIKILKTLVWSYSHNRTYVFLLTSYLGLVSLITQVAIRCLLEKSKAKQNSSFLSQLYPLPQVLKDCANTMDVDITEKND